MGDGTAAVYAVEDSVDLLKKLLFVRKISGELQDVLHESGLLIDDGEGVIDLMRYTSGNASEGRQFLCLDQLPLLVVEVRDRKFKRMYGVFQTGCHLIQRRRQCRNFI